MSQKSGRERVKELQEEIQFSERDGYGAKCLWMEYMPIFLGTGIKLYFRSVIFTYYAVDLLMYIAAFGGVIK